MAEINASSKNGNRTKSPNIDLTPMVDLGFLLITFFVFTATLNSPTAMTALLPANSTDSTDIAKSGAVSLLAGSEKVYFYTGDNIGAAVAIDYKSPDELRMRLLNLRSKLRQTQGNDDRLFVMIKPTAQASFGKVVDLLDEMKICQMKRYTLTDPTEEEMQALSVY